MLVLSAAAAFCAKSGMSLSRSFTAAWHRLRLIRSITIRCQSRLKTVTDSFRSSSISSSVIPTKVDSLHFFYPLTAGRIYDGLVPSRLVQQVGQFMIEVYNFSYSPSWLRRRKLPIHQNVQVSVASRFTSSVTSYLRLLRLSSSADVPAASPQSPHRAFLAVSFKRDMTPSRSSWEFMSEGTELDAWLGWDGGGDGDCDCDCDCDCPRNLEYRSWGR